MQYGFSSKSTPKLDDPAPQPQELPSLSFSRRGIPLEKLLFAVDQSSKLGMLTALGYQLHSKDLSLTDLQPRGELLRLMAEATPQQRLELYTQSLTEIAAEKAKQAYLQVGAPVVVEVSGLFIYGMEGRPGALISSFLSPACLKALCDAAKQSGDRGAAAISVLAFSAQSGESLQCRMALREGYVSENPRGSNGFGFDSIFIPQDCGFRTMAELSPQEWSQASALALAFNELQAKPFLAKASSKFTLPSGGQLQSSYVADLRTPAAKSERSALESAGRRFYGDLLTHWQDAANTQAGRDELRLAGEYPIKGMKSIFSEQGLKAKLTLLPEALVHEALLERGLDLTRMTHPLRLEAQLALERSGYQPPPPKAVPVFDRLEQEQISNASVEFSLLPLGAGPHDDREERTTLLLGRGLFLHTSQKMVSHIISGSSMPATVGAWSMATYGLLGAMSFVPADAIWNSGAKAQLVMIRRARELLLNDPCLACHPYGQDLLSNGVSVRQFLIERGLRCMGATLKPIPDDAAQQAQALFKEGVTLFRIYDPGATRRLYETVRALRRSLGDEIVILAGQCANLEHVTELEKAGADALIVGIGDGGICKTSPVAGLAADNLKNAYRICQRVRIPVIGEGGFSEAVGVAIAAGMAGVNTSGRTAGGTIEQPPLPFYCIRDERGKRFAKGYPAEAGPLIKRLGGQVDYRGDPINIEGVDGFVSFKPNAASIVSAYKGLEQGLIKSLRFVGAEHLLDLQHMQNPPIRQHTPAADSMRHPHIISG